MVKVGRYRKDLTNKSELHLLDLTFSFERKLIALWASKLIEDVDELLFKKAPFEEFALICSAARADSGTFT